MPVARPFGALSATPGPVSATEPMVDVNDGDAEGDGDDKQYCFCNRVSFGEMIACDEPACEVEWVSHTRTTESHSVLTSCHSTTSNVLDSPSRQRAFGSVILVRITRQPRRTVDDLIEVVNERLEVIVLVVELLLVHDV